MQYKDFDKQLIQLYKEEKVLGLQKRNLGWDPLVPPIQRGWKRFFVLREDVARSSQADFFENILAKINTKDWSYRKDFKIKKRKYGKKINVVKKQKLLEPLVYCFEKMKFTEEERKFFALEFGFDKKGCITSMRYVFKEPWRFVLRIKPNMIDKVLRTDSLIESRLEEIDNYLERNDYRKWQARILRGNYKWNNLKGTRNDKERNVLKNKSFHRVLDEAKKESYTDNLKS
jgi:hypothetical protein